jgi:carbonic anhydrase
MTTGKALDLLLKGHEAFHEHGLEALRERYESLAEGQAPRILFITCSDSRIAPTEITGMGAGDLFVIRNAGNIVPAAGGTGGEVATLEYAVKALGVEEIVVCGHSNCGAMKAVLAPESAASLPAVGHWIELAFAAREALPSDTPEAERLPALIAQNVRVQMSNIRSHDFVREAEAKGRLRVRGMVFDIGTARLRLLDD